MIIQEGGNKTNELWFTFEHINQLIEHIIWPLTVLIILLMYRKHVSGVIKRLGSFEAGATGISMTFDHKLEETFTNFLPAESSDIKSKSGVKIKSNDKIPNTPYHELLNIREGLHNLIINKAQEFNISTVDKSSIELCEILKEQENISIKNANYFKALIDLTNSGDTSINQLQVSKLKELYNNLKLQIL
ncbi:hypothetical protein BX611_1212 [Lutibacter oceani]|uniref:Uncharacterized protein n=1 Tax=Lutibacter oceani TaxID=1853311 RepID=A0A3D9RPE5_9FLAO|nr:hypothetical protein [Lutibacter oceani]REE81677.1 hypothetical protein BX611_1212 [Lutibacter oceani]